MSSFVRLMLFVCLMTQLMSVANGSKLSDLTSYYFNATDAVLNATRIVLEVLLPFTDGQPLLTAIISRKHSVERNSQICSSAIAKEKTCPCFNMYKEAFLLMKDIRSLKYTYKNITDDKFQPIDYVYSKWVGTCPPYVSKQKVSLFYTPWDKFLSHGAFDAWGCCDVRDKVDDWERNFYLKEWSDSSVVNYGDAVGVGYKEGRYLSNEGHLLKWYKTWMSDWEQFRVESGCASNYRDYGAVHMCDLVMFHAMDDGNYFKVGGRTKTRGEYNFAILDGQGHSPSWGGIGDKLLAEILRGLFG